MCHPHTYTITCGMGAVRKSFLLKVLYVEVGYNRAYQETNSHTLNLFIELALGRKLGILEVDFQ